MSTSQLVQDYLHARQQADTDAEIVQTARQALLACDKAEVFAEFESLFQNPDDEVRCALIVALGAL